MAGAQRQEKAARGVRRMGKNDLTIFVSFDKLMIELNKSKLNMTFKSVMFCNRPEPFGGKLDFFFFSFLISCNLSSDLAVSVFVFEHLMTVFFSYLL